MPTWDADDDPVCAARTSGVVSAEPTSVKERAMRKGTDIDGAASRVGARVLRERIERVPAGDMRSRRLRCANGARHPEKV